MASYNIDTGWRMPQIKQMGALSKIFASISNHSPLSPPGGGGSWRVIAYMLYISPHPLHPGRGVRLGVVKSNHQRTHFLNFHINRTHVEIQKYEKLCNIKELQT